MRSLILELGLLKMQVLSSHYLTALYVLIRESSDCAVMTCVFTALDNRYCLSKTVVEKM